MDVGEREEEQCLQERKCYSKDPLIQQHARMKFNTSMFTEKMLIFPFSRRRERTLNRYPITQPSHAMCAPS